MEENIQGLTSKEVIERVKQKKTNKVKTRTDESFLRIIFKNLFTYFNLIFLIISILLIAANSFRDLSFLPIILANVLIGIFQQIRSKITLDKLSLLDKNVYNVIRDGKEVKVNSDNLVEDDYVILESGSQIPADAVVISGHLSVNESLLTGEQDEIQKTKNAKLMSGSFVVSGKAVVQLTAVGDNSYSAKIMKDSKKIKESKSEMIASIDNIIKIAGIIVIPIGALLFWESYVVNQNSYTDSTVSMVSAIIGMIPEGLYLLTTIALALSAMRLAKKKVLLHDMKSIETLARVDVLCVDKTGTITTNKMHVTDIFNENEESFLHDELDGNIITLTKYINTIEDSNITMKALKNTLYKVTSEKLKYESKSEFNSKDKYSSIKINNDKTYKLGAPDILLADLMKDNPKYENIINKKADVGERVLVFAKEVNGKTVPILFISIENEIRKNAKEIFRYFNDKKVGIRVISGDNPKTVSFIAKKAGIEGYDKYVDCTTLKTEKDIKSAVEKYVIFGRVSPEQKRSIIKALKKYGLKVAMTGDGVNDILAMKEADCSISVGSGADAARGASQVVLLDDDFDRMKDIIYEGRKNVNNITRSASLFTYKNIFSVLLAVYSIIFALQYPLEPTQVSLGSAFTIGIPAFLLTFEENQKKQPNSNFMRRVLLNSFPAAMTSFLAIIFMVMFSHLFDVQEHEITTACSYLFFTGGFLILYKIIRPLNKYRIIVILLCIIGMIGAINIMPDFFAIEEISPRAAGLVTLFAIAEFSVIRWVSLITDKFQRNKDILKARLKVKLLK